MGDEGRRITEHELPSVLAKGTVYFGNRICPFAHRAWWTSKEVGFDMEYIHIDLGDDKPAWYSAVNFLGTVPCLYEDGHPIYESSIVAEYIAAKKGVTFMPSDPLRRADAEFLIKFFNDKILAKLYVVLRTVDDKDREDTWCALAQNLQLFDFHYANLKDKSGPYFLGKDLSFVEINIMPFIARFVLLMPHFRNIDIFSKARIPTVEKAYREVLTRPAFKETNMSEDFYTQFYDPYVYGSKAIRKPPPQPEASLLCARTFGIAATAAAVTALALHLWKRA